MTINKPIAKPNPKKVRFSFEYLQLDHPKFVPSECSKEYFCALFQEIARFQKWSMDIFMDGNDEHRHPITFSETTEPDGFPAVDPGEEDIWSEDAWQFALPAMKDDYASRGWRVHGFISEDVFYIVWFDPCHLLEAQSVKLLR